MLLYINEQFRQFEKYTVFQCSKGRWEGGSGWGMHVTPWLIHINNKHTLVSCQFIYWEIYAANILRYYIFSWNINPFMSPRYPGGPRPPLRIPNQALGGVPGSQPLLPSGMDPTRQQGHPNMGGPMQRMTPPRGMVPLGPQSDPWLSLQNYGGAMRPPLNALGGPGMPGMNMGPGGGRPWPNPTNANSIPYSSASPGNYVGPPGGGGPPGTPIMPSPADSTNSGDNMYTLMNAVPPGPNRPNFPMGPGSDGPMGGLGGMESHHMNGSLGSGDMDSISKNSPNNMSLSNQPGTPRDDGEMGGNFLNPFQSESVSLHKNLYLKNQKISPSVMRKQKIVRNYIVCHNA
ncbi:hypothetical protein FD755_000266 [Muntiacus reevesi]|uniref:Single stranded DNA binding protein 2 n=1 Tax=Muntiacus reevesi TaxID=9886 RepID=A0A5J5N3Y4_MUNRE|nr:hypothetical protein FD755_000266 [Muntiacus reevesi]